MLVIPIEKDNPVRNKPILVYWLIAINVGVFLATKTPGQFPGLDPWATILTEYGFIPTQASFKTAFSSMFLHGGFLHVLGNMLFLKMFGDNIEDVTGPATFLVLYLVCGLGAIGFYHLLNSESAIPCIGASGAISGVLGLYLVMFRHAHVDLAIYLKYTKIAVFHLSATGAVLGWLGEQTLLGVFTYLTQLGKYIPVAFSAHVGGLLSGIILGVLLKRFGVKIPPPRRSLRIERDHIDDIWCPYCGAKESSKTFGRYKCTKCGTRYSVFTKDKELKEKLRNRSKQTIHSLAKDASWTKINDALVDAILLSNTHPQTAIQEIHKVLASGININAVNDSGRTALAIAKYYEVPSAVEALLVDAGGRE